MLQDADQELIRRDVSLPGLRVLLDESAFLERVRRANPGREVAWARLRYLRYKPGTNCLAAYEVGSGMGLVRVQGKAWGGTEAAMRLEREREDSALEEGEGRLRGWSDPAQGMRTGVFPWDEKLRSLPRWMDAAFRRRFFSERAGMESLVEATGLRVLNHKPERRMVGCLERGDGTPLGVLKVHTGSGFSETYPPIRKVRAGERYAVPVMLGKSERHAAVVLGWQEGVGLETLLAKGEDGVGACARVGAALGEFHGTRPRLEGWQATVLAEALGEHARMLGWLLPDVGERVSVLATRLAEVVAGAPEMASTMHGDFYSKQVLVRGDDVVFLDLDSARRGSAWFDLATFLAHLEIDAIRGVYPARQAERLGEAFLEGYGESCGQRTRTGLSGWVAAVLLTQAAHGFRSRQPDWAGQVRRLLDRVAALVGAGVVRSIPGWDGGGRETGATNGFEKKAVEDPGLPGLARAMDAEWMMRRLRVEAGWGAELEGVRLAGIEVVRHKEGRRCLIAYRFERVGTGPDWVWLGKLRARRGRGWGLQAARGLREVGLDEASDVGVPEPVGEIEELPMELQRRVEGEPYTRRMTGPDGAAWAARCARAVGRLHGSGVTLGRVHGIREELVILRDRLGRLGVERPEYEARVARVLAGCEEWAGSMTEGSRRLVHRDFHPDQVLVDDERLWLLDLDLCAMGDPCLDHGNFMAHLLEWGLRHPGQAQAMAGCVEAYWEAALGLAGAGAEERLEGYVTLSLARHLFLCTQYADRGHTLPVLLELCERRLGIGVSPGAIEILN